MNLCEAILTLKMEENKQHFGISCFIISRKVKMQLKQKNICAVYGEGAATDRMCQKSFAKFLGTIDILAQYFFAVGMSYVLEDV